MSGLVVFFVRHGYLLLFVFVAAEQLGLPLPAASLLLTAGALAGTHRMSLAMAIVLPIAAIVICDSIWYELGRLHGTKVLRWLCRVSLEPDSCARRTQTQFERNGPWELVVAKFVPGLNAIAAPLAGITRMPLQRYALFDGLGAVLWVGAYVAMGYLFSGELDRVAAHLAFLSRALFALLLVGLLLYIGQKYLNRLQFLRKLRIGRISPEELMQRMNRREDITIIDLRYAMEVKSYPETIPGAVRIDAAELEEGFEAIPSDREVVLFCSCPNEATSAQMALRLRSLGITRIRPLAGGLAGWRNRGFPLQQLELEEGDFPNLSLVAIP
jgi:membrane protein DedA with SNARE-associated domain/rhodanese-related sulfurtransferase